MKTIIITLCLMLPSSKSIAWGPEGHAIVGKLAMQFVKPDVRQNVLKVLGNMSIDTAANWMDIMRSNGDYDFMKPWHYIEFPKEKSYQPTDNENIINRLITTYAELKRKNVLCEEQIKFDLLVLFHLVGDLHMPLHVSYGEDLGGNRVMIQYDTMKTHNLHKFWDEDIIRLGKITYDECMQLYRKSCDIKLDTSGAVDFIKWMIESRSILPTVYDFPDFTLSEAYLNKNKLVVQRQLLLAGMRLANVLNKLFYTPAAAIDYKEVTSQYKNGIDVKDAMKHIGKKVTICSRVFGIRATDKITQINLGDKFPNNPLTVIIFASSYKNFQNPPAEMYSDKNVCVKGKIEEYKGKPQILVEKPEDIVIK